MKILLPILIPALSLSLLSGVEMGVVKKVLAPTRHRLTESPIIHLRAEVYE